MISELWFVPAVVLPLVNVWIFLRFLETKDTGPVVLYKLDIPFIASEGVEDA